MLTIKSVKKINFRVPHVGTNLNVKCFGSKKNTRNVDYQYLQRSIVPTMHFQKSLPHLPIPPLKNTCERYLAAQRPLVDNESYEHVTSQVNIFSNGIGIELDKILRKTDKQNKHTSYISKMWFDMYLSDRIPLPINYNPFLVFNDDTRQEYNNQLVKSSNLLISSIRFMESLRAGLLEPEVFHVDPKKSDTQKFRKMTRLLPSILSWYGAYAFNAYPLDMSQYMGLFGSSRVPELERDRIVNNYNSKHILVQRRGYFYIFDVFDNEGNIIEPYQIVSRLKYIMADERPPIEYPIGILTTQDRDTWASQRHYMSQVGNEKNMKLVDTALFNLVLDDEDMNDDRIKLIRNFLHGDGHNRWFDKSFSLIITKDGSAGVNFEHSWGDGVAVLRYFQDIHKEALTKPFVTPETPSNEKNVEQFVTKLDFNLDEKLKENIKNAKHAYKDWCSSLAIDFLIYEGLGKNICKAYKISPDSAIQLGFQAAYHLMSGKYAGSYESCSTAAFKHGRTETMRPCTIHTKDFCDALHSASPPSEVELASKLVKCSNLHSQLVREASLGQGFDRHLFALKKLAERDGHQPGIFCDAEYKDLNTFIISTSTLSSSAVRAGGFGPVITEGLGIGYSVRDDSFGIVVTSYPPHNNGAQFIDALEKSLIDINKVIKNVKKD